MTAVTEPSLIGPPGKAQSCLIVAVNPPDVLRYRVPWWPWRYMGPWKVLSSYMGAMWRSGDKAVLRSWPNWLC